MLIRFFCQGNKKVYASSFYSLFIYLFSYSFLHTLSSTSMYTLILLLPLPFLSSHWRWLEYLPISHLYLSHTRTRRCRQCILFLALLFSLSLLCCMSIRFIPVPFRTREKKKYNKAAQRVDQLFYILEYACVCSSSYEYALFFFFTYYQFSPSLLHFATDKWK